MNALEIKNFLIDNGAEDAGQMLDALSDGELLGRIGAQTEVVEELYHELTLEAKK